ncbi:hypothetical protein BYT27DRAFT_7208128 [Phlegmacium glaucopus]|nr:hypothetical protein BYT27DRAFT_7208128 [Phlegmacium glaucopus]
MSELYTPLHLPPGICPDCPESWRNPPGIQKFLINLIPGIPGRFLVFLADSWYSWQIPGIPGRFLVFLADSWYSWQIPGIPGRFLVFLADSWYSWQIPGIPGGILVDSGEVIDLFYFI